MKTHPRATSRRESTGHLWAVRTAVTGTILIALGAFWLSFTALADLAVRSGIAATQAWVWPLIVDGIIVVSTVAVVALDGHAAGWYAWTLLIGGASVSVTANSLHAIVAAETGVPGVLAAAVAGVPPVVLLAITHLTVILIRHATTAEATYSEPDVHGRNPSLRAAPARSTDGPDDSPIVPAVTPASTESPPTEHGLSPLEKNTHADSVGESVHQGATRRERAAELRQQGWSNKEIARQIGVHASTVGRWFAREHLPGTTGEAPFETAIGQAGSHAVAARLEAPDQYGIEMTKEDAS